MSFSHLLILGIIAVIVIPPEKLPEVARQVAKFLGEMRRMTSGVFDDLQKEVVLTPEDMRKRAEEREQQQKQAQEQANPPPNTIHPPSAEVAAAPFNPPLMITPEMTEEQKKQADEEYQKHIQASAEVTPETKKSEHE